MSWISTLSFIFTLFFLKGLVYTIHTQYVSEHFLDIIIDLYAMIMIHIGYAGNISLVPSYHVDLDVVSIKFALYYCFSYFRLF